MENVLGYLWLKRNKERRIAKLVQEMFQGMMVLSDAESKAVQEDDWIGAVRSIVGWRNAEKVPACVYYLTSFLCMQALKHVL